MKFELHLSAEVQMNRVSKIAWMKYSSLKLLVCAKKRIFAVPKFIGNGKERKSRTSYS